MDVLICEDDPVARTVVSDLVESSGGRVLAALDSAVSAMTFLDRFTADVVVVDLMLRLGTGLQLVEHIRRSHPAIKVVVFTAHDSLLNLRDPSVEIVVKPDFERLTRVIASFGERAEERRRSVRTVSARPTAVDAYTFYRLVADARPDDVLLRIEHEGDGDSVAEDVRTTLRGHDFLLQRNDSVLALVLGGGADTVRALEQRIRSLFPHLADRTTSVVAGADPIDAFNRLTG